MPAHTRLLTTCLGIYKRDQGGIWYCDLSFHVVARIPHQLTDIEAKCCKIPVFLFFRVWGSNCVQLKRIQPSGVPPGMDSWFPNWKEEIPEGETAQCPGVITWGLAFLGPETSIYRTDIFVMDGQDPNPGHENVCPSSLSLTNEKEFTNQRDPHSLMDTFGSWRSSIEGRRVCKGWNVRKC